MAGEAIGFRGSLPFAAQVETPVFCANTLEILRV